MAGPVGATANAIDLWRRIDAFSVDAGDESLTFVARLARENDWTSAFAQRVFDEYKRFLFLACTAGHKVTPSDEVDQAWHLHLVYTESYWDHLCKEVLERPIHHGPTKGGAAEGAKFEDWYARTLESYQRAFGEPAPSDIWPAAATRFGLAPHFKRVNVRDRLLIPRSTISACAALLACLLAMGVVALALSQPSPSLTLSTAATIRPDLWVMVGVVVTVLLLGALLVYVRAWGSSRSEQSSASGGCGNYFGFGDPGASSHTHSGGHPHHGSSHHGHSDTGSSSGSGSGHSGCGTSGCGSSGGTSGCGSSGCGGGGGGCGSS